MARFDVVHKNVQIPDNLQPGELFQFVLREPQHNALQLKKLHGAQPLLYDLANDSYNYVLTVTVDKVGRLIPSDPGNALILADWKRRHANTPESDFV